MALAVSLVLFGQLTATQLFDKCVSAHASAKALSVSVSRTAKLGKDTQSSKFELAFIRPSQAKLRIIEPANASAGASDRTYLVSGTKLTAYDQLRNQLVSRDLPKGEKLEERLENLIVGLDESVKVLVDNQHLRDMFVRFRTTPDWSLRTSATSYIARRDQILRDGVVTSEFEFDRKSMLLRSVHLKNVGSTLTWKLSYGPKPSKLSLAYPSSARKVGAFVVSKRPPNYLSAAAQNIVTKAIRAYDGLKHAQFTISSDSSRSTVWMSGSNYREKGAGFDWSYVKGVLTIKNLRTGKVYRGKTSRFGAENALAAARCLAEPTVKRLMQHQNPVEALLEPEFRVRTLGTMAVRGVSCDVVELKAASFRMSISIRRDNGLLASIISTTLDEKGRALSGVTRTFEYSRVGRSLPASVFVVPIAKGTKTLPLPVLKN